LTTTTILYRTPQTHQVKHSFLIWIQKRLIFIDKLVLTNRILCFLWKFSNSEIKNHLKTLKSVCIFTNKEFFLATCSFLKLVTNMEELDMTSFDDEMDDDHLAHVAGCCKTLKVLKLNGFRKIPSSFGKFVANNTHLRHLDVGNSRIGDEELIDFIATCSSTIVTINLERNSSLENTTFIQLCCCKLLTSLNVCGCIEMDFLTITTILGSCCQVQDLNVRCCHNIINDDFLLFLSNSTREIKSLDICNSIFSRLEDSKPGITDVGVKALCKGCKNLECLDIGNNKSITMVSISTIARQLNKLKRISCNLLKQLDQTELLVIISTIFYKLEVIDLNVLALKGIPHPQPDLIPTLILTRMLAIQKQPYFTERSSASSYFDSTIVRLMLYRERYNLKSLKLNNLCSPNAVIEVFDLGFSELKSLQLTRRFGDDSLNIISVYCSNLEVITLTKCVSLTDYGVRALIDCCTETLVSFTCHDSELVTDVTVLYLAAKCYKTLQCFDVTGCDTEYSSVLHLIDKCKTLRCVEYTYNDPEDVTGNLDHLLRRPDSMLIVAHCQRYNLA
jgi:hypothetical protein